MRYIKKIEMITSIISESLKWYGRLNEKEREITRIEHLDSKKMVKLKDLTVKDIYDIYCSFYKIK